MEPRSDPMQPRDFNLLVENWDKLNKFKTAADQQKNGVLNGRNYYIMNSKGDLTEDITKALSKDQLAKTIDEFSQIKENSTINGIIVTKKTKNELQALVNDILSLAPKNKYPTSGGKRQVTRIRAESPPPPKTQVQFIKEKAPEQPREAIEALKETYEREITSSLEKMIKKKFTLDEEGVSSVIKQKYQELIQKGKDLLTQAYKSAEGNISDGKSDIESFFEDINKTIKKELPKLKGFKKDELKMLRKSIDKAIDEFFPFKTLGDKPAK
ncbi:MAG: hypothetical protein BGO14_06025 [Chlamydiales bacterium 38-26]|nr:hypothetical protein [Chlamydiales bacterium]OJV08451.1 MAG: hypothetical protein BGO14_06025 [Chlamydiales bacterium 38-26]